MAGVFAHSPMARFGEKRRPSVFQHANGAGAVPVRRRIEGHKLWRQVEADDGSTPVAGRTPSAGDDCAGAWRRASGRDRPLGAAPAALALSGFTLATNYYFHDFWNMQNEVARTEGALFLKNVAIAGGLLYVAGVLVRSPSRP